MTDSQRLTTDRGQWTSPASKSRLFTRVYKRLKHAPGVQESARKCKESRLQPRLRDARSRSASRYKPDRSNLHSPLHARENELLHWVAQSAMTKCPSCSLSQIGVNGLLPVRSPSQIGAFRLRRFRRVESSTDPAACRSATLFEYTDDSAPHCRQGSSAAGPATGFRRVPRAARRSRSDRYLPWETVPAN